MPPILAADIGDIIFFVVFAAVALIQWFISWAKEKAEAAKNERRMPTPEEAEARRRAWHEQTRPVAPPVSSEPRQGGMLEDLMGELRKALDQQQQPSPAPVRRPPPPLPKAAPAPAMTLPLAPPPRVEAVAVSIAKPAMLSLRAERKPNPLTELLRTEGGYRQAFVLREVLGPPRALHEYRGPD
jgi:hypothetical protein